MSQTFFLTAITLFFFQKSNMQMYRKLHQAVSEASVVHNATRCRKKVPQHSIYEMNCGFAFNLAKRKTCQDMASLVRTH